MTPPAPCGPVTAALQKNSMAAVSRTNDTGHLVIRARHGLRTKPVTGRRPTAQRNRLRDAAGASRARLPLLISGPCRALTADDTFPLTAGALDYPFLVLFGRHLISAHRRCTTHCSRSDRLDVGAGRRRSIQLRVVEDVCCRLRGGVLLKLTCIADTESSITPIKAATLQRR